MNKIAFYKNVSLVVALSLVSAMPKMVNACQEELMVATKAGTLHLRQFPRTNNSEIRAELQTNSHLTLLNTVRGERIYGDSQWYQVKTDTGIVGYVSGKFISKVGCPSAISANKGILSVTSKGIATQGRVTTNKSPLRIRQHPRTKNSQIQARIPKGTRLSILATKQGEKVGGNNRWYKVKTSKGKVGYASGKFIR